MDSTSNAIGEQRVSYLELVRDGTSDLHKPTYRELREEGLHEHAIETLMLARDALTTAMSAAEIAEWISLSQASYPLSVEDVYPDGPPCWCEKGVGVRGCLVHRDYDPTDAELEVAWNAPGAHEAHRAAWALHQGIESGAVA